MPETRPIIFVINIEEIDNGFLVKIKTANKWRKFYAKNLNETAIKIDHFLTKYVSYYLEFKKEE